MNAVLASRSLATPMTSSSSGSAPALAIVLVSPRRTGIASPATIGALSAADRDAPAAGDHVVGLADRLVRLRRRRRAGRDQHVIDVGPRRREHLRLIQPPHRHARGVRGRARQGAIEPRRHEHRNRIERHADARVAEIERIGHVRRGADLPVHPLQRLRAVVVDRVRMSQLADDRGRALHDRRPPIDGELRLAAEDHEHLLRRVVEVMPDAAAGRDLAAVQEVEVRRHRAARQQAGERHVAGAGMDRRERPVLRRIRVLDALGERRIIGGQRRAERGQPEHGDRVGGSRTHRHVPPSCGQEQNGAGRLCQKPPARQLRPAGGVARRVHRPVDWRFRLRQPARPRYTENAP